MKEAVMPARHVGPRIREVLWSTGQYYEAHATEYFKRTVNVDLSPLHSRFLANVPTGGRILDVGCGSGRDLRVFIQRGFEATGIDASRKLVELAAQYSSAHCHVMRIEELSYESAFDAVWACASLVHIPRSMLGMVLTRLRRALVSRGLLFASVQVGEGEASSSDGRFFAYYSKAEFEEVVGAAGFDVTDVWLSSDTLPGCRKTLWINLLARRID